MKNERRTRTGQLPQQVVKRGRSRAKLGASAKGQPERTTHALGELAKGTPLRKAKPTTEQAIAQGDVRWAILQEGRREGSCVRFAVRYSSLSAPQERSYDVALHVEGYWSCECLPFLELDSCAHVRHAMGLRGKHASRGGTSDASP